MCGGAQPWVWVLIFINREVYASWSKIGKCKEHKKIKVPILPNSILIYFSSLLLVHVFYYILS